MAVPETYRWRVKNDSGSPIAIGDAKVTVVPIVGSGAVRYGPTLTAYENAGAIATGTVSAGEDTVDNRDAGSDRARANALHGVFTVTVAGTPAGDVELYLEHSVDGGVTWPTELPATPRATITFSAAGTKSVGFEVE